MNISCTAQESQDIAARRNGGNQEGLGEFGSPTEGT